MLSSSGGSAMHDHRWRAYLVLTMSASRQPAIFERALAAFHDLGVSELPEMVRSTQLAADTILSEALRAAGQSAMPQAQRAEQRERVMAALLRFQSNQFKFANLADPTDDDAEKRFGATAVFAFTSRLNHCCRPSAFVDLQRASHEPGVLKEADGVLHVRPFASAFGPASTRNLGFH